MPRLGAPFLALAVTLGVAPSASADPIVVEQVVARVDGRPLLLSELRARARPLLASLASAPAWKRAEAERNALEALLERRIEEELIAALARRHSLGVSDEETRAALARIASDRNTTVDDILAQARIAGWTAAEYEREIARQLLAHKVLWSEANRLHERAPSPSKAGAWAEALNRKILAEARRQACIERRVRF